MGNVECLPDDPALRLKEHSEVRNLTWREFDWLMSGIDIDQPKALKQE